MTRIVLVLALSSLLSLGCERAVDAPVEVRPAYAPATELPSAMDRLARLRGLDNDARREVIVALLRDHGFDPVLQAVPNTGVGGDPRETGYNIIIEVGDGERELVIGAHFDASPEGEGMVDNGGSVIVLLHTALALRDAHLGHRIRMVFFDLEEVGLVGSTHFVDTMDKDRVVAMVNLDVNGYGDTVFYGQTAHGHGHLYEALARACGYLAHACIDFPQYPFSDHLAFQRGGIPNLSLSVLPRAEVHQLWLMMNAREHSGLQEGFLAGVLRTIHTRGDVFARIEPSAMLLAYNTLMALIHEFDP
jgi:hypothetical protein